MHLYSLGLNFPLDVPFGSHFQFFAINFARNITVYLSKSWHVDGANEGDTIGYEQIIVEA